MYMIISRYAAANDTNLRRAWVERSSHWRGLGEAGLLTMEVPKSVSTPSEHTRLGT